MKKILITTLVAGLVLPFAASAEWELISDFESEDSLDAWTIDNRLDRNLEDDEWDSSWGIVPRPFDDLGGFALSAAEGTVRFNWLDVGIDLGELPTTNTFTLFYELAQSDLTADRVFGLHPDTPDEWFFLDDEGLWQAGYAFGAYSTVHRLGLPGANAHNGTGYSPNYTEDQASNAWYRFWMVVNPVDFTWNLHVQGGEFAEVTQVTSNYSWRNLTFDPLRTWRMRLGGNAGDNATTGAPTYFDNLFLDRTGENLTLPPRPGGEVITMGPGIFSDYVVNDGWVDTGEWMGWVTVDTYPFFYVHDLDGWAYAGGGDASAGAWVFVADMDNTHGTEAATMGSGIFSDYVPSNGWVDTGNWMGMVYIESYPHVYMLSLNTWALSSEEALSSGAWVYVFK